MRIRYCRRAPMLQRTVNVSKALTSAWFVLCVTIATLGLGAPPASASGQIGIGVIGPMGDFIGKALARGAELAVDDVNAHGGVNGRQLKLYSYDDHASASNGVRAFQRAVQEDHVSAVVGVFITEVALALEPWAGRLKVPFMVSAAISPMISRKVHEHYGALKYTFMNNGDAITKALIVCQSLRNTVVNQFHATRAVILAENADWTKPVVREYQKCLPKAGLKVEKTIRYSLQTADFTPVYNEIENLKPQVIVAATAHNGLRPILQWRQDEVPALFTGINAQAISGAFWRRTNGAAQGVISASGSPVDDVAFTSKTLAFKRAYVKRFGIPPAFDSYTTYDAVHMIARAIRKAGTTKGSALVRELESMTYVGVNGRYQFYGKSSPYTHESKYGARYVPGLAFQWQDGKQVAIWPDKFAQGKLMLPAFIKSAFKQR